ncbi:MAG TPA: TIGR02710 family CRISPR-associated protein [Lentisphaeria bacterium]|nr:MAG: CRISPR-associated protein [Lentisphaerae bacterium GWF2_38_69]HBM15072.1 TIGR02710 family CRISPR-associated protein [Lentisphaeria bacterium]
MKILLISVGGNQEPVIFSIMNNKPDKIIFFVSEGTREKVTKDIIPAVFKESNQIPDFEIIKTPDEQDVGICVKTLLSSVPKAMRKLNIYDRLWPDIVDYTGGTKTLSSSLVWASAKYPCKLSYIGSKDSSGRSKDGLGIVQTGREYLLLIENPWDKIAYFEVESAMLLFNKCQYASSASILRSIVEKISDERLKVLVSSLCEVVEGYAAWDAFDHFKARRLLESNREKLTSFTDLEQILIPGLKPFIEQMIENIEFLRSLNPNKLSWPILYDLLANSARRAFIERKYEDASARCYAVIEKIAKYELQKTYGINTSNASPELLPEAIRSDYIKKYSIKQLDGSEKIQFGAIAAYEILSVLNNTYGKRFNSIANIRPHLTERNQSILAHGIQPMDKAKFDNLFLDALKILNISENELIKFPTFSLLL